MTFISCQGHVRNNCVSCYGKTMSETIGFHVMVKLPEMIGFHIMTKLYQKQLCHVMTKLCQKQLCVMLWQNW